MQVPPPEDGDIPGRLEKCIRQGDWGGVARFTVLLTGGQIPQKEDELAEYLRSLEKALISARVARSNLLASLRRVRAAERFTHTRAMQMRQGIGDPAEF